MTDDPTPRKKNGRKTALALAVVAATAVGGFVGYQALADSKMGRHAAAAVHYGGWHGGGRGGQSMTEAELEEKIDRLVAHAAIEIDATDAQRDKIAAIAKAAANLIRPLREAMLADGEALRDILLSDSIDPARVEEIRAARLAEIDTKSKIVAEAVVEIAAVLTLDQRRTLEERIREFRGHRGGWRR